jgi:hypothetical protein
MRASLFCLSSLLLSGPGQSAWAAHPLVTDDTSTQGKGNYQVELNSDWARSAGETGHVAAFTLSRGTMDALDLYGNLPVSLTSPSGIGDLSFGAKWRFWQNERSSLAVKPELFLATGNAAKGLGKGSASLALTLIASHIVGRWGFDANIGITANRDRDPPFDDGRHLIVWRISGALAYTLTPRWTLVADTGIARNAEKAGKTNPAFILAGAIYTPRSNVDIDIGIKAGLTSVEVHRQAGAGLTVRF